MIAQALGKKFKVLKNAGTLNNHIGLPLTLLKLNSAYDLAVVEIGTNHFGEVSYLGRIARPDIGVITNIGPGHLAYFRDLRGVFREKYDLINSLRGPSIAVLNADDEFLRKEILKKKICPFILGVGIKNRGDFRATDIRYVSGKPVFRVNRRFKFALKTLGYYNVYNALSAIAVARIFGLGYRDIASALAAFDPPANRLNFRQIHGIRFIDDSYNSNPLSMKQALGVLRALPGKGRRILVMGDMLELGVGALALHEGIIAEALAFVDTLITVGPLTRSCASKAARRGRVYTCETSSEAREVLFKTARADPRDIILVKGSRGMKMEEVLKI
ncbi:MAG: UDP-N-acetylmuramoyl-tripeptide--D-alanyl-D-alanine ligase, partial [Candidatus Omnitrophota bacterium]